VFCFYKVDLSVPSFLHFRATIAKERYRMKANTFFYNCTKHLPGICKIFAFALSTQITETTIVVIPVEVEIYWAVQSFLKHCPRAVLWLQSTWKADKLSELMKCTLSLIVSFLSILTAFYSSIFSLTFADMFCLLCVFPKKIEFYQVNNMSLSQSDVRNVWQRLSGTTTFNCAKKI